MPSVEPRHRGRSSETVVNCHAARALGKGAVPRYCLESHRAAAAEPAGALGGVTPREQVSCPAPLAAEVRPIPDPHDPQRLLDFHAHRSD